MKKYINPFDFETEKYSKMFDKYFEQGNIKETKILIKEVETKLEQFDELSRARLRYLFYEVTQKNRTIHYADKDNLLLELDDLPLYSIRIEKMKTVFRQLYSMFDKIAYFINSYYELGIPERKVSFKNIWNERLITKN